MKTRLVVLAVCCLLSASLHAQWLETTITLDSIFGVNAPDRLLYNSVSHKVYATGGDSGLVLALDAQTNQRIARIPVGLNIIDMCFDPQDDKVYCLSIQGNITVINGVDDQVVATLPTGNTPEALVYNPASDRVYCVNYGDGTVTVISGQTNSIVTTVPVGRTPVALCCDPASNRVYTANRDDSSVAVIDCATDSMIATIPMGFPTLSLACNPVNNKVYCGLGDQLAVIDGARDSVIGRVSTGTPMCYNPRGNRLYCADSGGLAVVDGATDSVRAVVPLANGIKVVYYDSLNDRVYCAARQWFHDLTVIDGTGDTVVTVLRASGFPSALCCNPASNKVYSANGYNVELIDGATSRIVGTLYTSATPSTLGYNPTGNKVYCGTEEGDLKVIDGATDSVLKSVSAGAGLTHLFYTPANNKLYAAASTDNWIKVLDGTADTVIATIDLHSLWNAVVALSYCPDLNRLYCAHRDTLTVIDCASDSVIARLMLGNGLLALCYDSAGNKLYAAGGGTGGNRVTVLNCADNQVITTINTTYEPVALCYDAVSDKVYCANYEPPACLQQSTVTIIDGATDSLLATIALPMYSQPRALCCNPVNNRIYCANWWLRNVAVIDGASNQLIDTVGAFGPSALLYNQANNKVYCANYSTVSVIPGWQDTVIATIPVGDYPTVLVWNPVQNRVYTANSGSSSVSVIRDSATGVQEPEPPSARCAPLTPGIVRRVLWLPTAPSRKSQAAGSLLDVTGREATKLFPGPNDVSRFAPGVYFVRLAESGQRSAVRKVVLQH
jgi:YVTN family beta-propeller protein